MKGRKKIANELKANKDKAGEKIVTVRLPLQYIYNGFEERYIVLVENGWVTQVCTGHGHTIAACKSADELVDFIAKLKESYKKEIYMREKKNMNTDYCEWCSDKERYSIIDNELKQVVPDFLVKCCPICGKKVEK